MDFLLSFFIEFLLSLFICDAPYIANSSAYIPSSTEKIHSTDSLTLLNGSFEDKFKRYVKYEKKQGASVDSWNAVAWKGERVSKQLILWSTKSIRDIRCDLSDLASKQGNIIPQSALRIRFLKYIKGDPQARDCAKYDQRTEFVEIADALGDDKISYIDSTDPLKIWVNIDVPPTTKAGWYKGTISVYSAQAKKKLVFKINLNVTNYALPAVSDWSFHLNLWQFPISILDRYNDKHQNDPIQIWSDAHLNMLESGYRLLANTGQKSITTYIKDGAMGKETTSMAQWIKQKNGKWKYDFSIFEKYVTRLMSWGITGQIECFAPISWNKEVIPYFDEETAQVKSLSAPLNSDTYRVRWDDFLTAFKQFLDTKGWFDKTILFTDEVHEEELMSVLKIIHSNNPNWKIGYAFSRGLSAEASARLYDVSGILLDKEVKEIVGFLEEEIPSKVHLENRSKKITTFYTSCSNLFPNNYVSKENSPAEMTWMAWHALKENYNGYLRWAFDNWKNEDPFDAQDGAHTAGDFSMCYRSSNEINATILSSMRLEMLREGIEDYEKVKILKKREKNFSAAARSKWNALKASIQDFHTESGRNAYQLVMQGEKLIDEISAL